MTNCTYKSGSCREQVSFFPPRLEDYVGRDNPVRAIEAYVMSLDLAELGFRHSEGGIVAGQPAYTVRSSEAVSLWISEPGAILALS